MLTLGLVWMSVRLPLNQHVPSRTLSHQAPLEAYPHAMHGGTHVPLGIGGTRAVSGEGVGHSSSVPLVPSYSQQSILLLGGYSYYLGKQVAHLGGYSL